MEKRICSWCGKPMLNSWHKSADGNYIHMKCQNDFKSHFQISKPQLSDNNDFKKGCPDCNGAEDIEKRFVCTTCGYIFDNEESKPISKS